uniref:Uncharacterized protein n=1 Tax=viral metagenome TaxID=1070528 RepID=A0A6C0AXJ0_9ZZZZ|tara:strand:+ start:5821 stop:6129 length:309 start_codon:yes stop_codon:yes gene_type:complete
MNLLEQFKSAVVGGSRKRRKHRRSKRGGSTHKPLVGHELTGGRKHKKSGKKSRKLRKSRKSRKSHKKGGNMALKAAALPFSLLALQRLVGKKRSLKRRRSRR